MIKNNLLFIVSIALCSSSTSLLCMITRAKSYSNVSQVEVITPASPRCATATVAVVLRLSSERLPTRPTPISDYAPTPAPCTNSNSGAIPIPGLSDYSNLYYDFPGDSSPVESLPSLSKRPRPKPQDSSDEASYSPCGY